MHVSALKQSNFLTRADCGRGILVTIRTLFQENVAKEGAPQELRWCVAFDEHEKPMILNSTNGQIIASITHSEETDHWVGHKIVLYDDPNVSFGGKLVGGIRVRAPRVPAPARPAPAPTHGILGKPLNRPEPAPVPVPVPAPAPALPPPVTAYEPAPPEDDDVPF